MQIDEALVRRLVAAHMPEAGSLPIVALTGGWDNRSFRLGERLVARLPSADHYVPGAEKECRVLPLLASLPLPTPRLVASFPAGPDFPRPWSVLEWIEGETAEGMTGPAQATVAVDLAAFLRALHAVDPAAGPTPGAHSFGRGGPLARYDEEMRWALPRLGARGPSVAALWKRALANPFAGPPVWLHGDLHPGNLLVRDGRLAAVIDWACPRRATRPWICRSPGGGSTPTRAGRSGPRCR
jgi:aminoglycoside phosphotransferase (APT) family kinase protein